MVRFSAGSQPVSLRVEASLNLGQVTGGEGAGPSGQPKVYGEFLPGLGGLGSSLRGFHWVKSGPPR